MVSTGAEGWTVQPCYLTNPADEPQNWTAIGGFSNFFTNGNNITVFSAPADPAAVLTIKITPP